MLTTPPLPPKTVSALNALGIHTVEDLRLADPCRVFLLLKQQGGITMRVFWQMAQLAEGTALTPAARASWQARLQQCPPVAVFPPQNEMERWMRVALAEAKRAGAAGEIPVGAVVVCNGQPLAAAGNACIAEHSVCAHAEIRALKKAGHVLQNYRLCDCDVYITLEPCLMCAAALIQARVRRVIYAAAEPKSGAAGSVCDLFAQKKHNPHTAVLGGVLAAQAQELMRGFFRQRRHTPPPEPNPTEPTP
ncbi:tRNA adenosine(34) deaminase TadA [Conchiformibius kuhniae]|uniref:tRNA-specific adenosine deaminase n=1 Tax=Conchiformibius kuhniae TaxID=211502 RepID=A0A8T9N0X3_9NEIS|nr:tRNA adenosine(34) deaminase TadA [Conchiformibius kuhniae]UOP05643.1 tRNA adenosine(34) deaminase TadA [Conchiformibius kuhniae]